MEAVIAAPHDPCGSTALWLRGTPPVTNRGRAITVCRSGPCSLPVPPPVPNGTAHTAASALLRRVCGRQAAPDREGGSQRANSCAELNAVASLSSPPFSSPNPLPCPSLLWCAWCCAQERPGESFDSDNVEHMQWIFNKVI